MRRCSMTSTTDGSPAPAEAGGVRPLDRSELTSDYVAPRDELETYLAGLWSEALRTAPIGVEDDFFELGGHSLMAAELLREIQRTLRVQVSARTLYLQPTIAELAEAIAALGGGGGGGAAAGAGGQGPEG